MKYFKNHEVVIIVFLIFLLFGNIVVIKIVEKPNYKFDDEMPKAFNFQTNIPVPEKTQQVKKIPSVVSDKTIYLTFDDGPSYLTCNILDILRKENVPATFFVIGPHIYEYKDVVKKAYDEGHTIAIHSDTHKYSEIYADDKNYFNDLYLINEKIYNITGHHSHILRFPGGSSNLISKHYNEGIMTRITEKLIKDNYYYFDWNIDSGDASGTLPKEKIIANATGPMHAGTNIILFHDASTKKTTVEALPYIIRFAKANGYTFSRITKETMPIRHKVNN